MSRPSAEYRFRQRQVESEGRQFIELCRTNCAANAYVHQFLNGNIRTLENCKKLILFELARQNRKLLEQVSTLSQLQPMTIIMEKP